MNKRIFLTVVAVAAPLWFARAGAFAGAVAKAVIGQSAPAFEVIDASEKKRTLAEFKGHPVVLEWTSPSCPFAKAQYDSGRMQELQKWATQNGVVWLTILSSHRSRSDYLDPAKAAELARSRGAAQTALLIDASGDLGHAFGAKTANHMFIIDREGVLVYAGGIDDGETMVAKKVLLAHNHVRPALDDVLAGRPVKNPTTAPFGCALAYAG